MENTVERTIPTDEALFEMVKAVAERLIAETAEFTAYGITLLLRQANPAVEINHPLRVREMVHDFMAVAHPEYGIEVRLWGGVEPARTYFPVHVQQKPVEEVDATLMQEVVASGALSIGVQWAFSEVKEAAAAMQPSEDEEDDDDDFDDDDLDDDDEDDFDDLSDDDDVSELSEDDLASL